MRRLSWVTAAIAAAALVASSERVSISTMVSAAGVDPHAYFNALIARSDHWKSYGMRSASEITWKTNGGYIACSATGCPEQLITYSPSTDTDPHAQDAAKVV